MKRFAGWMAVGLLAALAGCSGVGGLTQGGDAKSAKTEGAPERKFAATVRVLPYTDERNMGNPRKIGVGAENLSGFGGFNGTDILLPEEATVFVTQAMSSRISGIGYQVVDQNAMYELGGSVKELTYNVKARDEVSISVESTLKETATGRIVWAGVVVEKKDRFAGVSGNNMDDVIRFLKARLGVVTQKTADAFGGVLMVQRPELFNILPGMKAVPGVTVLNAADPVPAASPAPAAAGATKGFLVISTTPPRAKVYLDQVYYGLSPLRLDVESGIHAVTVKQSGYKVATEKVSVRQGDTTELELKLER